MNIIQKNYDMIIVVKDSTKYFVIYKSLLKCSLNDAISFVDKNNLWNNVKNNPKWYRPF